MRSNTSKWLEVKVRYARTVDEGTQKKVTETYVVNAITYSEAEKRIYDELTPFATGEMEILCIKRTNFTEIYFTDSDGDDRFFKAKLQFITIDEKTSKEKTTSSIIIIQSSDTHYALNSVNEIMQSSMMDYKTPSISETSYSDVFE